MRRFHIALRLLSAGTILLTAFYCLRVFMTRHTESVDLLALGEDFNWVCSTNDVFFGVNFGESCEKLKPRKVDVSFSVPDYCGMEQIYLPKPLATIGIANICFGRRSKRILFMDCYPGYKVIDGVADQQSFDAFVAKIKWTVEREYGGKFIDFERKVTDFSHMGEKPPDDLSERAKAGCRALIRRFGTFRVSHGFRPSEGCQRMELPSAYVYFQSNWNSHRLIRISVVSKDFDRIFLAEAILDAQGQGSGE